MAEGAVVASALLNAVDAAPANERVQAGVDFLRALQAGAKRGYGQITSLLMWMHRPPSRLHAIQEARAPLHNGQSAGQGRQRASPASFA